MMRAASISTRSTPRAATARHSAAPAIGTATVVNMNNNKALTRIGIFSVILASPS
ncbi:MAG: hypothetical protein IPG52_09730 [Rhodocyclaceae bacterium]|nr:hypothetical protein [Rhodocyclaceae bacterium]